MSRGINLVGLNRWQSGDTGDSTPGACALGMRGSPWLPSEDVGWQLRLEDVADIGRIARRAASLLERFRRLPGDGAQGILNGRDRSSLANVAWKSIRFMMAHRDSEASGAAWPLCASNLARSAHSDTGRGR